MMLSRTIRPAAWRSLSRQLNPTRLLSTLEGNLHIYIFPDTKVPNNHILTLLPTIPVNPTLSIGTTTTLPPTPSSLSENPRFLRILHSVLRTHAAKDPFVISQAAAFASPSGSGLSFISSPTKSSSSNKSARKINTEGPGGGAAGQGGAGGAGKGGWIHVSDTRNPPDYGRIAWPEDIFGSLEVDGQGEFVDGDGRYQESGSYRVLTREGFLGLTPYLREKLVQRLKEENERDTGV